MSGKIALSAELEIPNPNLFNAVKRSFSNASQKRKLDIVHDYASDPRCKLSIVAHSIEEMSRQVEAPIVEEVSK